MSLQDPAQRRARAPDAGAAGAPRPVGPLLGRSCRIATPSFARRSTGCIAKLGPDLERLGASPTATRSQRVREVARDRAGRLRRALAARSAPLFSARSSTTCSATARSSRSCATQTVTEIMVNGPDAGLRRARRPDRAQPGVTSPSDDHLLRDDRPDRLEVGRRVDEASPMVDARLPDGSRVNAIIPPLALCGPTLTIRKFSARSVQRSTTSSASAR